MRSALRNVVVSKFDEIVSIIGKLILCRSEVKSRGFPASAAHLRARRERTVASGDAFLFQEFLHFFSAVFWVAFY